MKLPSIRRAAIGGHHDSPQLRQGRFHNLSPRPADMPAPGARGLWNALFNKPRSTVPRQPLPVLSPSRAELDATVDGSLFRLGHSTLLLKLAGSWWLTDPVFSERASPLPFAGPKRFHAPPVALADLPPIRGVILSHDHYDHLDRAAIKALVPLVELFLGACRDKGEIHSFGL
ncbi:MBL fold metallo-hydrolase [Pseudomonas aeruginosa]|uniref:MBL fold metallo-hydrolase n=2 Tax=Pseudomonas aeruginosa TaxID=287 RepID=UPI00375BF8E2